MHKISSLEMKLLSLKSELPILKKGLGYETVSTTAETHAIFDSGIGDGSNVQPFQKISRVGRFEENLRKFGKVMRHIL